ncbi:antibiotic biosynthesis monooxygenase [Stutzerimonas stutzeri]|uniref:antibiotic biosynthesis monooxygenase n=1 Tax=Stutzerimonas stutzeri TaxID=316 RepID=UPI0004AF3E94|nr:antibiotic biosynthesis monooxygenase [Stutzerimonas stutzeri]MCQ4327911.1 antibiotic biosynthesis monooxygenase [Stutzerimonas stutzeri]
MSDSTVEACDLSASEAQDLVTLLVRHRVQPGRHSDYERWLRRTVSTAAGYPGHLGVDVIRSEADGSHLFTSVLRFASPAQLQTWLESDDRRQLITEVGPLLADGDVTEINRAREFWFNPTDSDFVPPRWKQACITFMVILPLSLLVPSLWQPAFAALPWLGGYVASNVVITLSIVLLVVYLFMPRVTRWFAGWLNAH